MSTPTTKVSDLFVACLEAEGVEYVFGIPGEENLDLLDSLSRSSMRLVLTRHEQAAGFMAATYGRLTGKAGVCLSTLGPGATNLVTAGAYAQLGGMPMVMLTGQKPIKSGAQGLFQLIDVVDMMQPITKSTERIDGAPFVPARIRAAFRAAEQERPGATHLELPEDIAQETVEAAPLVRRSLRRPLAEDKALEAAAALLEQAERPLLLIGAGANRKLTCRALRSFVAATGIPFVTTQMGKGVVDETDPRCLGTAALTSGDIVHRAFEHADLIVTVGHDVIEKPPFKVDPGSPDVPKLVHVHFSPAEIDPVYAPQLEVVGDIANVVWRLEQRLANHRGWSLGGFDAVRTAVNEHVASRATDGRFPLLPERLVADVRRVLPENGIAALDNGMYKIWFARNYAARLPNTLLLDNALASMGAGLPSAMAAKLVHPDRPVVAICGDGGFMMNSQELETAVRLGLDLVVLILRDDAYGMIKWKQEHMELADFGLDFANPDFVAYARAYGARGHRVEAVDQLAEVLASSLDAGGVHLIDVPVDYSENDRVLNEELPALARDVAFD